jgi:hypothetical protein
MPGEKWSQDVTEHSDALDLEEGVFTLDDPADIARSLKRSAEHSRRGRSTCSHMAFAVANDSYEEWCNHLRHDA